MEKLFCNNFYRLGSIDSRYFIFHSIITTLSWCLSAIHYESVKYKVRHLTFFFQLVLISWMITLSSCLIWQIISFILPPNENGCVYAWTTLGSGPAIDLQKMSILEKKIIFSDEARFDLSGYVNKQNCRIRGTENLHDYIEKPTYPKRITVCNGFWSRGTISPFFFENEQGEAVTVNGDRSRTMLNELLLKRRILTTFGFNRTALRATQPKLHSMFCFLF